MPDIDNEKTEWYLVSTYSGSEEKVKKSMLMRIKSFGKENQILRIEVPVDYQVKLKGGKRDVAPEKVYPGYVLVEMIMNDETWLLVRKTPNVIGFVGPAGKPTPLSEHEVDIMLKRVGAEEAKANLNFDVNDSVRIIGGPFSDMIGVVEEINMNTEKAKVRLMMFGRDMPVELDFINIDRV
jgi:transcription termination/antitermination protein NusG